MTLHPAPPTKWVVRGAPPSSARKLVEMRDVSVVYGDRVVFEHLDWTVRAGERWLLAGPNGCGKTTLLAFVIGDHPQAYANDVRLFGVRRGTDRRAAGHVVTELGCFNGRREFVGEHGDLVPPDLRPVDAQLCLHGLRALVEGILDRDL